MQNPDPLANFLGNLASKIKTTQEHKNIMEAVYASASAVNIKETADPFTGLMQKIGNVIAEKLPSKTDSTEPASAAHALGEKIKHALEQAKQHDVVAEDVSLAQDAAPAQDADDEPVKQLAQKIKDAIERAKSKALQPQEVAADASADENITQAEPPHSDGDATDQQITSYIDELEKIKDTGTTQQKEQANTTLQELKDYIDKTVKDYSRRILDLGGGGGSVAQQFAHGGTMDGTLNVTGNILSGGKNIADYFGTGGGGGSGDPAVNALVHTNSAFWDAAYTNLTTNSASYLLSGTEVYLGDIPTLSGNWNSNFTTTNYFSAFWNAAVDELFNFYVTQTDPGSAFISEDGNYYLIANSKLDNVNLWNQAYTQIFLLSSSWSSVYVTVLGASARWESVYSTVNANSAGWESTESTVISNSASWSSVYNTYNILSASYAAETLAIAYAVAL